MEMLDKAKARAHGAVDQVAEAAAPAAKWLEEHGESLSAQRDKLADTTVKYIAAHPLQSLGMALAAGYLIGRLTR
ncbi:MAG: DUF883 domain-containing protein [Betaproteobacteria bacterium]|nr:MAG: DUF883 domain-containing protein [Betaproteobacteria bacterium]